MSVASKNPFALLNDNETDSVDKSPVPEKTAVEAPKPNRKPSSTRGGRYYQRGAPKPVISTPPVAENDTKSPTDTRKNYNRGDRGDRPPREDRGDRGDRGYRGDRGGERGERGERGEYRGRGGRGRGGGGRGRGDRDARPDRHSATGIVDTAKKVGAGWGNSNSEYKDETNAAEDAKAGDAWGAPAEAGDAWAAGEKTNADGADPWAEPATTGEAADGKPAADDEARKRRKYEDEEDEGKMTLDEYKAKAAASETIPKLELRQVNDGESEVFKGAKQLTKDPDADNYFVGKQAKSSGAPRARKEAKQYLELDARFEPPSRGGRGRGRGGRGDYRGGGAGAERPHRGGRSQQQQQRAVDVDDTTAFPSL